MNYEKLGSKMIQNDNKEGVKELDQRWLKSIECDG